MPTYKDLGARLTPIDMTTPDDDQDDPCNCFDPENPTPTSPERSGGGSPIGDDDGIRQIQLVGQCGVDAEGNPIMRGVEVTPAGELKLEVDELPHGFTGTIRNDNATFVYINGRLITRTFSGSGGWSDA